MEGKSKAGATVVTEAAAQAVLRRGAARELGPDEERVMRMRLGASVPRTEPLERVGRGFAETEIDLLAFEIEAFLALRERRALEERRAADGPRAAERPRPSTPPSRAKQKIIRALRKKR